MKLDETLNAYIFMFKTLFLKNNYDFEFVFDVLTTAHRWHD